jgi:hypothetical protein
MVSYRRLFVGNTGLIEIFSDRINGPFAVLVGTKRETPDLRFGRDHPVVFSDEYVQIETPDRLGVLTMPERSEESARRRPHLRGGLLASAYPDRLSV